MPSFGEKSKNKLATCHPVLSQLLYRVVEWYDLTVIFGYRNEVEQNTAFAEGKSSKPWPESKHNTYPSMAADIAPWPIPEGWGDLTAKDPAKRDLQWKERVKFYILMGIVLYEWGRMTKENPALKYKYMLRVGGDWNGDGDYRNNKFDDLVHVELVEINNDQ